MSAYNRILIVTDLSALSNLAIPHGYAAVRDGGTVVLMHLLEHDPVPSPLYAHYAEAKLNIPTERDQALAIVRENLKTLIPPEARDRNVTTQVDAALHRVISEGIIQEAVSRKVDAIVMATHGRTGLGRLVLGSVAQKVVESSPVPVLMVPQARK